MSRIVFPLLILLLIGGIIAAARAQTIGCGNAIFGSLTLITSANAQTITVPCAGGGTPPVTVCLGAVDTSVGCALPMLGGVP